MKGEHDSAFHLELLPALTVDVKPTTEGFFVSVADRLAGPFESRSQALQEAKTITLGVLREMTAAVEASDDFIF